LFVSLSVDRTVSGRWRVPKDGDAPRANLKGRSVSGGPEQGTDLERSGREETAQQAVGEISAAAMVSRGA